MEQLGHIGGAQFAGRGFTAVLQCPPRGRHSECGPHTRLAKQVVSVGPTVLGGSLSALCRGHTCVQDYISCLFGGYYYVRLFIFASVVQFKANGNFLYC